MNNKIVLSNLDKVYWPDEGYTKKDLVNYYLQVKDYILPYLKDRPESMNRFPDGINGGHFYHKNSKDLKLPSFIKTKTIRGARYILCQNDETLLYLVNLGCIEINPWNSRSDRLDKPDYLVLDLDPVEVGFTLVVKSALEIKKLLDNINVDSYPKTSGATGLHIYIPVGAKYTYDQIKSFAKIIATIVNKKIPQITSIERLEEKRKGRVYLDYLQNNEGQTLASAYSVRPVKGATVSTPLLWREVNSDLDPKSFNILNVPERIKKTGDLFLPVLEHQGVNLTTAMQDLRRVTS